MREQLDLSLFSAFPPWISPRGDRTVILIFNPPWGRPLRYPIQEIPAGCEITSDRRRFREAAAVVFHLPELRRLRGFRKPAGQRWVAWWMECEAHYPQIRDPDSMGLFDLTMSHHQDADVFTAYCQPELLAELRTPPRPKRPDHLVALFASAPYNASGRFDYIAELMQHLSIHSYGRRMGNRRLIADSGTQSKLDTIAHYKFTLAFENAIAQDYVTEKFFQPLLAGSVPVYLGAPNIEDFAPGDHCFINTADFASARDLAAYLLMLNSDDNAYAEYFHWKAQPLRQSFLRLIETQRTHAFVRLCQRLSADP
ncbi:MAG: glycosyltransferase family 10 [Synechococcaceae cyanobacterium]|nr:glycosyltransferase family 10 [Synechococcaceae cyanobacterium]